MQVDAIILMQWYDPRILGQNIPGRTVLITRPADIRRFWLPDLYFPNGQTAAVVNAIESVQKVTVHSDGRMDYAMRIMVTTQCALDLVDFPHDTQYCQIRMSTCKFPFISLYLPFSQHIFWFLLSKQWFIIPVKSA